MTAPHFSTLKQLPDGSIVLVGVFGWVGLGLGAVGTGARVGLDVRDGQYGNWTSVSVQAVSTIHGMADATFMLPEGYLGSQSAKQ